MQRGAKRRVGSLLGKVHGTVAAPQAMARPASEPRLSSSNRLGAP